MEREENEYQTLSSYGGHPYAEKAASLEREGWELHEVTGRGCVYRRKLNNKSDTK